VDAHPYGGLSPGRVGEDVSIHPVYASRTVLPPSCKTRFRLAGLCREGELNPLDYYERFPSCYISFPFPGFILTLYSWKAGVSGGTFPALDITTTATGLLCWRDPHPLEWHLASLHGQTRPNCAVRVMSGLPRSRRLGRTSRLGSFVPKHEVAAIGIGGSLAAPPLPHHRTYGSVYGGSRG
jgi:hypothetical protein